MQKKPEVANFLKAITFNRPEWIPASVSFLPATWLQYGKSLEKIVLAHPGLFPQYQSGDFLKIKLPRDYQQGRWVDVWGVTWEGLKDGLANAPVESLAPLRDWAAFDSFRTPDPLMFDWYGQKIDWEEISGNLQQAKNDGSLAAGGLPHGAMYMRL